MRIAYLSQYYPPEPGAPAARVSELARAWVRAGHEVTVLSGLPHHPTGIVPPRYRRRPLVVEDDEGVRVVRTWLYASPNAGVVRRSATYASYLLSASALGQLALRRPDVVVATSPQFLVGVAGRVVSALRGVPFVFEVRDLWPESIVAVGALSAQHPVIRGLELLERGLYRSARAIVVVSPAFKRILVARGVPAGKLHVVTNGVDLARFRPRGRDTALRQRLGLGDAPVVAYVGTHGMAHGLDTLLEAAKRLEDGPAQFLFVGEGAERGRLEARARELGLTRIRFLGSLPRDEIPEVYATADVCVVPLRKSELFKTVLPSKIFEILAMQRPLVLSVDGEARRLVERSGGGVFTPPEDAAAMAQALRELTADPGRAAELGRRGRAFVEAEFDRERLALDYLDVLQGVASR